MGFVQVVNGNNKRDARHMNLQNDVLFSPSISAPKSAYTVYYDNYT